jgi:hypothetical protein
MAFLLPLLIGLARLIESFMSIVVHGSSRSTEKDFPGVDPCRKRKRTSHRFFSTIKRPSVSTA